MGTLGNSEAVRRGNAKGRQSKPSPARETASAATPDVPEREPEDRTKKQKPSAEEEFDARMRRNFPGLSDAALAELRKQFLPQRRA